MSLIAPLPGFCHPYYERWKQTIIDWLDGRSSIGGYHLYLPVVEPVTFQLFNPTAPVTMPERKTTMLRKEKAYASAPYVGRPFVYWWFIGVDDNGRYVGGTETTLAYITSEVGGWRRVPYVTGTHAAEVQGGWCRYTTCLRCGQDEYHEIHRED